jgi:hypothetical protein
MPSYAPWLKSPDLASDWLRGVALGQQTAEASQRLQAEQTRTAMEAQARSQTLQREALEEQQRIAISKAYRDAEIGLRQQQLRQVAQINAEKTRQSAMKLHQQTTFNSVYKDTGDVQKALFASGLGTPQNVLSARRDVEDLGAKRLAQREEGLQLREREYQDKLNKKPVPRIIGHKTIPSMDVEGGSTTMNIYGNPEVPAQTTTDKAAPAKGVKRFKWDANKAALVPVAEAAPADSGDIDEANEQ